MLLTISELKMGFFARPALPVVSCDIETKLHDFTYLSQATSGEEK